MFRGDSCAYCTLGQHGDCQLCTMNSVCRCKPMWCDQCQDDGYKHKNHIDCFDPREYVRQYCPDLDQMAKLEAIRIQAKLVKKGPI